MPMHADQSVTDEKVKSHTCCIVVRALPKSCIDKLHQEYSTKNEFWRKYRALTLLQVCEKWQYRTPK